MTDFSRKKIAQKSVGQKLRALREAVGLSVDDMVTRTKIRRFYIIALENDDWSTLPSLVYSHGFIANYVRVVGGDVHALIRAFDRESRINKAASFDKLDNPAQPIPYMVSAVNMRKHRVMVTSRWLWFVASSLIIGGLVLYLYGTFQSFVAKPLLVVTTPTNNSTVESLDVIVTGRTTSSATVTINNQPVVVGTDGKFHGTVVVSSGVNDIIVIATNRFDKTTQTVIMVEFRDTITAPPIMPIDAQIDINNDLSNIENIENIENISENTNTLPEAPLKTE